MSRFTNDALPGGTEPLFVRRRHTVENPLTPLIQAKAFTAATRETTLVDLSRQLLEQQKLTWPQLATGYASLGTVRLREVHCRGFSVWLQYNPGRIVSTGAKVDARSIRERQCFLCVENLPELQKGIVYKDEFLILCNPAPIFAEHFTISHIHHVPQILEPYVLTMLDLARDLSPRLTVFYNGPKCGASAPDHMHFQANPAGLIPVETAAQEESRRVFRHSIDSVDILTLRDFGRQVIVLESRNRENLADVLNKVSESLRQTAATSEEPMINVLCSFADGAWRVIVFPRSKHRPDVYFMEDAERVLISPAAVDIGGLVVTPLEKDFRSVNATLVESIFQEVSLPPANVDETILRLS
jgi:hypothetical protein